MKVINLLISTQDFHQVVMGAKSINFTKYPPNTTVHKILYDKPTGMFKICIHNTQFEDIGIVKYNYQEIPEEKAELESIPSIDVQLYLFLRLTFPILLQDYASIQYQIKDRSEEDQLNLLSGLFQLRIGEYMKMINEMENATECQK